MNLMKLIRKKQKLDAVLKTQDTVGEENATCNKNVR